MARSYSIQQLSLELVITYLCYGEAQNIKSSTHYLEMEVVFLKLDFICAPSFNIQFHSATLPKLVLKNDAWYQVLFCFFFKFFQGLELGGHLDLGLATLDTCVALRPPLTSHYDCLQSTRAYPLFPWLSPCLPPPFVSIPLHRVVRMFTIQWTSMWTCQMYVQSSRCLG